MKGYYAAPLLLLLLYLACATQLGSATNFPPPSPDLRPPPPRVVKPPLTFNLTSPDKEDAKYNIQQVLDFPTSAWLYYKKLYSLSFSPDEERVRFGIFKRNAITVYLLLHNPNATWTAGLGPFSHLNFPEFSARLGTVASPPCINTTGSTTTSPGPGDTSNITYYTNYGGNEGGGSTPAPSPPSPAPPMPPPPSVIGGQEGKIPLCLAPVPKDSLIPEDTPKETSIRPDGTGNTTATADGWKAGADSGTTDGSAGSTEGQLARRRERRRGRALLQSPASYDWGAYDAVSPVRDQGNCGSGWAFAPVAAVESLYRIRRGSRLDLSEEQLVDCADAARGFPSLQGCARGVVADALQYMTLEPVAFETYYRYNSPDEELCEANKIAAAKQDGYIAVAASGGAIDDYIRVGLYDHELLIASVFTSPTTVAFQVLPEVQFYVAGVYSATEDCTGPTNHAMLVTGYSTSLEVWKLKNSWGTAWGERGYMRVRMIRTAGSRGMCGMYTDSWRPLLLTPAPGT